MRGISGLNAKGAHEKNTLPVHAGVERREETLLRAISYRRATPDLGARVECALGNPGRREYALPRRGQEAVGVLKIFLRNAGARSALPIPIQPAL